MSHFVKILWEVDSVDPTGLFIAGLFFEGMSRLFKLGSFFVFLFFSAHCLSSSLAGCGAIIALSAKLFLDLDPLALDGRTAISPSLQRVLCMLHTARKRSAHVIEIGHHLHGTRFGKGAFERFAQVPRIGRYLQTLGEE